VTEISRKQENKQKLIDWIFFLQLKLSLWTINHGELQAVKSAARNVNFWVISGRIDHWCITSDAISLRGQK
jgi:hypothetical protein